jgi:hypothetical protein
MDAIAMLTAERLPAVLAYDPETGAFRALGRRRAAADGEVGTVTRGRRVVFVDGKGYRAHRLAWLYVHGAWPAGDVDHIDGNPLNNALANLRDVSRTVNMQNLKRARSDSRSGLMGASKCRGRWQAQIVVHGKRLHLGMFATAEAASAAYLAAKRRMHEGNTL